MIPRLWVSSWPLKDKTNSCTLNENKGILPLKGYWAEVLLRQEEMVTLWRARFISCWLELIIETALDEWMVFETFKRVYEGAFLDEIATRLTPLIKSAGMVFLMHFQDVQTFAHLVSMKHQIPWVEGSPSLVRGTWGAALPSEKFETSLVISLSFSLTAG